MNKYDISIIRIGYSYKTIAVEAINEEEATEKALAIAGEFEFTEKDANYEVDGIYYSDEFTFVMPLHELNDFGWAITNDGDGLKSLNLIKVDEGSSTYKFNYEIIIMKKGNLYRAEVVFPNLPGGETWDDYVAESEDTIMFKKCDAIVKNQVTYKWKEQ